LRARLSSEFPGATSPPDGASAFEVSIDDVPFGRAVAVRDDGLGRPRTLTATNPRLIATATNAGRHRLRFSVVPGSRAHGLCLYGKPGEKPKPGFPGARIELAWSRTR
jgi:hypothetical protein